MRGYKNFEANPHPGSLRHLVEIGYTENAINENGFGVVIEARADERRVLHALFGAESGQDAAESFGPVAWTETFALARQAHNDVRGV